MKKTWSVRTVECHLHHNEAGRAAVRVHSRAACKARKVMEPESRKAVAKQ